jgi:AcrR family transcriptional regulator
MIKRTSRTGRAAPARERLLRAAVEVFGRDGLEGATTRAIARQAGVNEVTLFRLFHSKEKLLEAVVGQTFPKAEAPKKGLVAMTSDLREDLTNYAQVYESMLTKNLPLIRTLIGEIHRHQSQERKVVEGIFRPLRDELVERLKAAQRAEEMRDDLAAEVAADLLGGMIFAGALRRSCPTKALEYSREEYLRAGVETLLRGIEKDGK